MLEMTETATEKTIDHQNWFSSLKENSTTRQKRKEAQEKKKKALAEENERFRSFVNRNR